MQLKKSSAKKLSSYSALAAMFAAVGGQAEGQIFYTDITPDVVLDENGEFYQIDFNGDAIMDVEINKVFLTLETYLYTVSGGSAPGVMQMNHAYATALGDNSIAATSGVYGIGLAYPYALPEADEISAANNWLANNSQSIVYSLLYQFDTGLNSQVNNEGFWFGGETDKYMGIRFNIGANQHYGWLRMDVSPDNKIVTIKDFAFDNLPGDPILAGEPNIIIDTTDILDELFLHALSVYNFQNTIYITINNNHLLGSAVQLFNTTGQILYDAILNENKNEITLKNISSGFYIVRVFNGRNNFSKEVFISN